MVGQILETLRYWNKHSKERNACVMLGDIKHVMNPVDVRVTNFMIEAITLISAEADFYFVRGNHDSITTQDGVPSCVPTVVSAGSIYSADDKWMRFGLGKTGMFLWAVPYFRNPETQKKAFQEAAADARSYSSKAVYKVLAFHNEVSGCQRNAHTTGTGLTLDDIDTSAYDLCVSGHIHRPQVVIPNRNGLGDIRARKPPLEANPDHRRTQKSPIPGAVYFAGSPFTMDWGEVNEEKSFFVSQFTSAGISCDRIPSKIPGWFDPDAPGFFKPKSWKDTQIRIRVPIISDPQSELKKVREEASKKYPGAILNLVPQFQSVNSPDVIDIRGGDEKIIKRYLESIDLPSGVTDVQMEAFIKKYLPAEGLLGIQGVKFGKTHAREVLCFEDETIDFDQKGLTLVTGVNHDWNGNSNGSGKSSLVSLPFIPLFGRTFKGQTHDGWARQNTKLTASVLQTITLADGSVLKVERERRPGKLRVWRDNKEITMGSPEATQKLIESLTNLTWSVLTNAVYIGQQEIGSVFGTEKERKELFSRLLGLERFINANEKMRKYLRKMETNIALADSEIFAVDAALDEARSGLLQIQEALTKEDPAAHTKLQSRESDFLGYESAKKKAQNRADDLDKKMDLNQKVFDKLLYTSTAIEIKIQQKRDQRNLLGGLTGNCPTCGVTVDIKKLEKSIFEMNVEINKLEFDCGVVEQDQAKNRHERRGLFEAFQLRKKEAQTALLLAQTAQADIAKLKAQLESRQRLERIINQKQERIKKFEKQKSIHERARLACIEEETFVEACIVAVGRDGLPAYLAAAVTPELNAAASRYSEVFSDGTINIAFEAVNGDIEISVKNESGGENVKDQSKGEMRMAANIAAFAFRDILVPHNILILDEPGEGLDSANAAAFARGLSKVIDRFQHIVIVSHNPYILGELEPDRIWQVEKRDKISTVTEV
jgi:DNA repair exonuclease SbcCD nuclease subunit